MNVEASPPAVRPVPPWAVSIEVPFQLPEMIVPTVAKDDKEVMAESLKSKVGLPEAPAGFKMMILSVVVAKVISLKAPAPVWVTKPVPDKPAKAISSASVVVVMTNPLALTAKNVPAGVPRLGRLSVPKYPKVEEA